MNKNCLTCGWGIKWVCRDPLDNNNVSGLCQWECPVPHPPQFGPRLYYSAKSKPVENCPAWKPADKSKIMQKWAEHPEDFHKRIFDTISASLKIMEQKKELESQCLRCANEPAWEKSSHSARTCSGTCKAGMNLWKPVNDSIHGVLVNNEFLTATCPTWTPKEADNG